MHVVNILTQVYTFTHKTKGTVNTKKKATGKSFFYYLLMLYIFEKQNFSSLWDFRNTDLYSGLGIV